jgi:hypothetical protein
MSHVEKLADLFVLLAPIFLLTALERQYKADWHTEQYWSWRSGDTIALQMMQLLGMIAVGV